jgi:hypothetical protein
VRCRSSRLKERGFDIIKREKIPKAEKIKKCNCGFNLVYGGGKELAVRGYIDSNFVTNPDDFKLGYVFTLNKGAVSYKSSKHDTITDSTIEMEYIMASEAAK